MEADREENWVELHDVKQVRQLSMGSQNSAKPGRFDSQPFEQESAIRALPALICRWKLTTVLKEEDPQRPRIDKLGDVKWVERCYSSLDTDISDMESTDSYGNYIVEVIGTHPEPATHGDVGPTVALPNNQNTLKSFRTISDAINDIPLDNQTTA